MDRANDTAILYPDILSLYFSTPVEGKCLYFELAAAQLLQYLEIYMKLSYPALQDR